MNPKRRETMLRRARRVALNRSLWHERLTDEVVLEAAERSQLTLDNPGLLVCGNEQEGCEPDARNYKCESCGADQVFGAAELVLVVA
jgi:hypothetical protein